MKNKIFNWNFRNKKEYKEALRIAHDQLIEKINPDLYYYIEITEKEKKRTLSQNNLYQIFATYIANNCSQFNNATEVKHIFRCLFLAKPEEEVIDFVTLKAKMIFNDAINFNYNPLLAHIIDLFTYSTTTLSTKQFNEYLENIARISSEVFELPLVFPEEDSWQDFFNEYNKKNKL
jgi:hypothetical protein